LAGFPDVTDKDCAIRAIAIATGVPYNQILDMVASVPGAGSPETGVDLTFVARLLVGEAIGGTWKVISGRGAQLTIEGLEALLGAPLGGHPVLIVEVEFSELHGTTRVIVSHLTAVVDGVVQDIQGMVDPATGCARVWSIRNVYAPSA
jgi:hypothetical protein